MTTSLSLNLSECLNCTILNITDCLINNGTALNCTHAFPSKDYSPEPHHVHHKNVVWEVAMFLMNILIFVSGVTGNMLTTLTIFKDLALRHLQHFLVFSLAVTDLITLLIVLPLNIITQYVGWPFGEFTCKYILPVGDVVPAVSIVTLVSINIDRYRAIVHSLSETPSKKLGISLSVVLWVLCYIVIGIPLSLVFFVGKGHWAPHSCHPQWPDSNMSALYYNLKLVLFYIVPTLVIFFCYLRIRMVLGRNLHFLQRSTSGRGQITQLRRQKRVITMFFTIFVTFFVCMLPLNLITHFFLYSRTFAVWIHSGEIFQLSVIVGLANSSCNPIILYFLGRNYRDSFRKYLPCLDWLSKRRKDRPNISGHTVSKRDVTELVELNRQSLIDRRISKDSSLHNNSNDSLSRHRISGVDSPAKFRYSVESPGKNRRFGLAATPRERYSCETNGNTNKTNNRSSLQVVLSNKPANARFSNNNVGDDLNTDAIEYNDRDNLMAN